MRVSERSPRGIRPACISLMPAARNTIIEMLRLCPGDNLGQRDWLGSVLLKAGRTSDALSFAQAWLDPQYSGLWPPRGGCVFDPPSKTPLSDEFVEKTKRRGPGAICYTAALASFKLWGGCELASQYLRIAANVNPHVLVKILGRVDQPSMSPVCRTPITKRLTIIRVQNRSTTSLAPSTARRRRMTTSGSHRTSGWKPPCGTGRTATPKSSPACSSPAPAPAAACARPG